jgi:3-hydroxybutyryl-CoA dehydratase
MTDRLAFDDLAVGMTWLSGGRTVTEADVVNYAGFSGDFNPIHMDAEFAKQTPFRGRIAHGLGVFCIASGLATNAPTVRTLALLNVKAWQFVKPVMIGDTIRVKGEVIALTPQGRGKRGEVVWRRTILNQRDEVVQTGELVTLVEATPK